MAFESLAAAKRNTVMGFLSILKKLFPRGRMWNFRIADRPPVPTGGFPTGLTLPTYLYHDFNTEAVIGEFFNDFGRTGSIIIGGSPDERYIRILTSGNWNSVISRTIESSFDFRLEFGFQNSIYTAATGEYFLGLALGGERQISVGAKIPGELVFESIDEIPSGAKYVNFDLPGTGGAGTEADPYKHDDFWNGAGGASAIYACKGVADATVGSPPELPSYSSIIPWGEAPVFLGDNTELTNFYGDIEGCIFWNVHCYIDFPQGVKLKNCYFHYENGSWASFVNDNIYEAFDLTIENCTIDSLEGIYFPHDEAGTTNTVNWINSIRRHTSYGDDGTILGTLTQNFTNTKSNGQVIAGTTVDNGGNDFAWGDSGITWPTAHDDPADDFNVLTGFGFSTSLFGRSSVSHTFAANDDIDFRLVRTSGTLSAYYRIEDGEWTQIGESILSEHSGEIAVKYDQSLYMSYLLLESTDNLPYRYPHPVFKEKSSLLGILMWAFARELDRFDTALVNLKNESVPGLSDELLPDWEDYASFDGQQVNTTTAARQLAVHAAIHADMSDGMCEQFFIDYATSLGMTITIGPYSGGEIFRFSTRPGGAIQRLSMVSGEIDPCRLNSVGVPYLWTVTITADPNGNINELMRVFQKFEPAWGQVHFIDETGE